MIEEQEPKENCRLCHGEGILTTDHYNGDGHLEELPMACFFPCPCTYYDPELDDWMEEEQED